jgi:hypothetical protein
MEELSSEKKEVLFKSILGKLGKWDVPSRLLEFSSDYLVEYPGMTYGDWREYKRHRIQSYLAKDLDTKWGYMLPPLAIEMDESKDSQFHCCCEMIKKVMQEVEDLFKKVSRKDSYAAQYCVTRLHYRPAIAKFNIREAFHLIKLRTGPTAHPFIRRLMWPLVDQMSKHNPLVMSYLQLRLREDGKTTRDFIWSC